MLVVADSSPLIVLVQIEHVSVLPKLFGQILVPPAVARELCSPSRPQVVGEYFAAEPAWLSIRRPVNVRPIPGLHLGETEALSLAIELHADLVLVDERKAYREAVARSLNAIGTVRLLERAAEDVVYQLKTSQ